MDPIGWRGRIESTDGNSVEGLLVRFEPVATVILEGLEIPSTRTRDAVVDSDGRFSAELLADEKLEDESIVRLYGPTGALLVTTTVKPLVDNDQLVPLTGGDDPAPIQLAPGSLAGKVDRVAEEDANGYTVGGRVMDRSGQPARAGTTVRVFEPAAVDSVPTLVFQAKTDGRGYFRSPRLRGKLKSAVASVDPSNSPDALPIALTDDNRLPDPVILVADGFPPKEEGDCECDEPPTANPDGKDLATAGDVFTTDLGTGRCIDPTIPNRTLEEFSFYQIVRTTDPAIKGPQVRTPVKLPIPIAEEIKKLGFGLNTLESNFGEAVTVSTIPLASRMEVAAEGGFIRRFFSFFSPRAEVPPLDPRLGELSRKLDTSLSEAVGAKTAKLWRDAVTTDAADGLITSDKRSFGAAQLEDAIVDVDGFTPINLMTAERMTIKSHLDAILMLVEGKKPGRQELNEDNPIDWDDTPEFYQATTIAHGHILQFKQRWKAAGYSLGELAQSIPLAPCQKKQIVTLDWDRREAQEREESLTSVETLEADISRDRDINEIANASFRERSDGGSEATTAGGGGGFGLAIGPLVIGGAGGAANASSSAWQDSSRNTSMQSLNQLRDRTSQGTAAVRSQRSSVVHTLQQGERVSTTTEVIANHNHCHALTIQYFEVLRHFSVDERLVDVRECLFIPLLMTPFNDFKILRWHDVLFRACRKPSLRSAFAAVERLRDGTSPPDRTYADDPIRVIRGRCRFRVAITRPRDLEDESTERITDPDPAWQWLAAILGRSAEDLYRAHRRNVAQRERIYQEEIAPEVARRLLESLQVFLIDDQGGEHAVNLDTTVVSRYREGAIMRVDFNDAGQAPSIARRSIVGVAIRTQYELPEYSQVVLERAVFNYETERLRHNLYSNNRVLDDIAAGDDAFLSTDVLSWREQRNPRAEDEGARRKLIRHLNAHIAYYHRAIWLSLDPQRRFMLLDGFLAPFANGRSVASVVENRLIGVVGNCLVMPVAPGYQLDPVLRDAIKKTRDPRTDKPGRELLDYIYRPLTPIVPRRLSVPTKGVFAEAVQGKCNSCEVIDDTLFWRWSESPCPDDPPLIDPVSTASRRTDPLDTTPTALPAPIVAYQQLASAPDPTGVAAALDLLSKNIFKDISGLTLNQQNALGTLQQSLTTATSFAQEAASLSNAQAASRDLDRNIASIQDAKDADLLTEKEASAATRDAILQSLGEQPPAKPAVTDVEEVKQAIADSIDQPGAFVSISRDGPGGSETIEVTTPAAEPEAGDLTEGAAFRVQFDDDVASFKFDLPYVNDKQEWDKANTRFDFKIKSTKAKFSAVQDDIAFNVLTATDAVGAKTIHAIDLLGSLKAASKVDESGSGNLQLIANVRICYPRDKKNKKKLAKHDKKFPVVGIVHGQANSYTFDLPSGSTGVAKFASLTSKSKGVSTKTIGGNTTKLHIVDVIKDQDNHKGYEYLQEELAKQGIVSISVSTNLANFLRSAIRMRSETLMRAVQQFKLQVISAAAGTALQKYKDRLDFDNVGLIGHSRGGEAIVDAKDVTVNRGIGIKAICAVSPTDFNGVAESSLLGKFAITKAEDIPYFCFYGAYDGDVFGGKQDFATGLSSGHPFENAHTKNPWHIAGTGFRMYDRCNGDKAMVYLPGVTHNRLNTVWTAGKPNSNRGAASIFVVGDDPRPPSKKEFPKAKDDPRLSVSNQKNLLRGYAGQFMRLVLKKESRLEKLFRGDSNIRISGKPYRVMNQWEFGKQMTIVNNFAGTKLGTTTHTGGVIEDFSATTGADKSYQRLALHDAKALVFDLSMAVAPNPVSLLHKFPAGSPQDFDIWDNLNIRLAFSFDVSSEAKINSTKHPKFDVIFEDTGGQDKLTIPSSKLVDYRNMSKPDYCVLDFTERGTGDQKNNTHLSFQTIRIPAGFVSAPPKGASGKVNASKITGFSIVFDTATAPKQIFIESILLVIT